MSTGAAARGPLVERFGNLELPLGGKYEYAGVRGKQGKSRDRFQGYTPKKQHFTRLCDTAHEAAVALATLKVDLAAGFDGVTQERKPRKKRSRRCIEVPHASSELGPAASSMAMWLPAPHIITPACVLASSLRELTPEEGLQAAASGTAVVRAVCAPCLPPRVALPAPPAMERAYTVPG